MNKLIFRFLYKLLHSKIAFIAMFFFTALIGVQWFIGQRFFTQAGTTDLHRFFSAFPFAFILYVPLIVSLCRVKNQWAFPFSSIKICLASILAAFTFAAVSMVFTMAVPLCISFFGNVEWAQFWTGYFGIALFAFCALSFTALIFSLIDNTAAAFVVSALCLALCNSIHNIPLYAQTGAFLSFIIKCVSFAWNFDSFAKGILNVRTVLYFVLASSLFIFLIYFKAEKAKGNGTVLFKKASRLFCLTFVLLACACSFVNVKFDLTRSKKFSVTKYSKTIAAKVSEPLSITYYLSSELKKLYPQVKDVSDYLETYAAESASISFKIINPSSAELQNKLSSYGINGQPVRTNSISSSTVSSVYSAVVIDYLGTTETIPFVLSAATLEFDLAQKITSLIEEKKNLVQVVIANGLDAENDYSYLFPYLKSLGYVPFLSRLTSEKTGTEENKSFADFPKVPLIVMGSENFTKEDSRALESFILDGGRAFIASQPYSIKIKDDWSYSQNQNQLYFERMLFTFGIYFKPTLTCDVSNFRLTLMSDTGTDGKAKEQKTEYINYSLWPVLRPQVFAPDGMTAFWPCAFDTDNDVAAMENFSVSPMLATSSASWQMEKTDGAFITSPFACPASPLQNQDRGSFTIGAAVSAKENAEDIRLILIGDQYCFSTPMLAYSSSQAMDFRPMEFLGNSLLMLDGSKELLALKNKSVFNYSLYKVSDAELSGYVRKTFFICIVLPAIIILAGAVIIDYKRRRFYK